MNADLEQSNPSNRSSKNFAIRDQFHLYALKCAADLSEAWILKIPGELVSANYDMLSTDQLGGVKTALNSAFGRIFLITNSGIGNGLRIKFSVNDLCFHGL